MGVNLAQRRPAPAHAGDPRICPPRGWQNMISRDDGPWYAPPDHLNAARPADTLGESNIRWLAVPFERASVAGIPG
jgi:hypothetical protein